MEQKWYWNRNGSDNLKGIIYKSWLCFLVKSIDFEEVSHAEEAGSLYFVHCDFTTWFHKEHWQCLFFSDTWNQLYEAIKLMPEIHRMDTCEIIWNQVIIYLMIKWSSNDQRFLEQLWGTKMSSISHHGLLPPKKS